MFAARLPIRTNVNLLSSSDNHTSHGFDRPCPGCGRPVALGPKVAQPGDCPEKLDRLAHALCGCYVLSMPAGSLARLLLSVLEPNAEARGPSLKE